ncbi:MAG TPA: TonB-dependent receptor [Chthoniobacteraceae bacterium]|nr:TonB-dependent receptor [Chthoniobacteraceae bacterium]
MRRSLIAAALLILAAHPAFLFAQDAQTQAASGTLPEIDVVSKSLDVSRNEIQPSLGATKYTVTQDQIEDQSQGDNAPINQTLLRFPGVAQDSYSQLHVRGEHANLQYRIDGVELPEGISVFGQELSTRFVDNLSLITGALPAQYGQRTAGIIDIQTKNGTAPGGEFSLYGGSYDTIEPSFEYGGSGGKWTYYFTGNFLHDDIGIENPTSSSRPIHDNTDQFKGFGDISYIIDDTSRVSFIFSGAHSNFQIPDNPGQPQVFALTGVPVFNSSQLNETQTEQSYFGIISYQKKLDDGAYQISAFSRYSGLSFQPDDAGDLIFNGVSSAINRGIFSNGLQGDGSYKLNDSHTLRAGFTFTEEHLTANTSNFVFPVDSTGAQSSSTPFNIEDDSRKQAYLYGAYLQDEWKFTPRLTLNYGARFDVVNAFVNESQLSPRINLVYQPTDSITLHTGYARYFTPPPLELVSSESVTKFAGTTNQPAVTQASPVKSERSNYFDAGITDNVTSDFQAGFDAYYKVAKNQIDEGQFGPTVIFSPFNYAKGDVYGAEFTANYHKNGFEAYSNIGFTHAMGTQITSGQFQFAPDELSYIDSHWVHLDHEQHWSATNGVAYTWEGTRVYADMLYGSGLRDGFANTSQLPAYVTFNTGIEHEFKIPGWGAFKARFDIVNLFDKVYEIRDGSGIGVFAPQYGQRRGFYGGISYSF